MSNGTDSKWNSRKWWGLWITVMVIVIVTVGEAFARLKWPNFTLGDLPWTVLVAFGSYAGFNVATHWAYGRNGNNKPSQPGQDAPKEKINET